MCHLKRTTEESFPVSKLRGWTIAIATTISYIIMLPLSQAFCLLYRDVWIDLEFTGTQITFLLCTSVCMCYSPIALNASLIEKFGYRIVAFLGGCFVFLGCVLANYSTTFEHFVASYSVVQAFGIGMALQAFPVALRAYFPKSSTKVSSYVWAISGLGPILMPQMVAFLADRYDEKFITLVIAGMAGIVALATLMLKPVVLRRKENAAELRNDETRRFLETSKTENLNVEMKPLGKIDEEEMPASENENTQNLAVNDNQPNKDLDENLAENNLPSERGEDTENQPDKTSCFNKTLNSIKNIFDVTLLRDVTFLNIIMGLSLDFMSEMNYINLLPFIMTDKYLDTDETAIVISTLCIAEMVLKLLAPLIADLFKLGERAMLIITLTALMFARSSLLFVTNMTHIIICSVVIGALKGMRAVYSTLVIPNYVASEKLPNAMELQFVINGIQVLNGGYIIGLTKDLTESYLNCIHVINAITLIPIITWTAELFYKKCKSRRDT